jgi:ABC-type transport system substrate-binding protein
MNSRESNPLTRRNFLKMGVGALAVPGLTSGCDFLSTEPGQEGGGQGERGGASGRKGREAPQLAEMVKNGELPPVEERLPEQPMVVEPVERIGVYGGTWNTALLGVADTSWLGRTIGYEGLVRWDPGFEEVLPNVAESFEASDDGTEYTFRLRRGMKWSDGEPFTADDIIFAYEDFTLNEELNPVVLSWLVRGDEPGKLEKVDDHTVRFTFSAPNGLFLERVAASHPFTAYPRHYLEQFHKEYNPDVEQLVEDEDAADWVELFFRKSDIWQNGELPRLHGWVLTTALGEGSRVVAERNPYYWKTDPDGSQLPYIDRVVFDLVEDQEVILLKVLNGEIDMHSRHINTLFNKPVLARNRQRGDYHFFDTVLDLMNEMLIHLNLTHKDKALREVFQNKDFRIGLSYAIDRQEIIDVLFQEQGEPWQSSPRPESEFYHERLARQYTEYDVQRANQHLDRAGYVERDGEGFRLGPDGRKISFVVEATPPPTGAPFADMMEMVEGYWREVGVDVQVKPVDRSLLWERMEANAYDATLWPGDTGLDVILAPYYYFPYHWASKFAPAWGHWYLSGGEEGQEPPEAARRQMELYDQLTATPDESEQGELMRQILDIAAEEFWVIGTNQRPKGYGIVKNDFHNVPQQMPTVGNSFPDPAPTNPEQYFITEE